MRPNSRLTAWLVSSILATWSCVPSASTPPAASLRTAPSASDARAAAENETRNESSAPHETTSSAPTNTSPLASASTKATQTPSIRGGDAHDSFIWDATLVDRRSISHLAAGKRRVAAVTTDQTSRRLLVFETKPSGDGSATLVARVDVQLPTPLQNAHPARFALFMGRDDWPRLIVVPTAAPGGETYHRYRPATGWESPRDEQGALASTGRASGYYGVLGHVDPEVLCVPDFACYEKRVRGWYKRKPPGSGVWQVVLTRTSAAITEAWAWPLTAPFSLSRLDEDWQNPLPALQSAPVALLSWEGSYVAVTPHGVLRAPPIRVEVPDASNVPSSLTSKQPAAAPSWSLVAPIEGGTTAMIGPRDWLLVGNNDGLSKLEAGQVRLTPVTLRASTGAVTCGRVSALQASQEPSPRYFVACQHGLFQLHDVAESPPLHD